jgi:Na+/melibiose symporter-like transporter
MNNISFNAMMPMISNDSYDQTKMSTLDSIFTSVGSIAAAMAIPLLGMLGGLDKQSSWAILVGVLSVFALAQLLCFFNVHEKKEIAPIKNDTMAKSDIRAGFHALMKTKYFYIAIGMFLINYYMSLSISSVGKYYAQWILGNANYSSLLASLPMITMGIGLLLTPVFAKKLGKRRTLMTAVACVLCRQYCRLLLSEFYRYCH